MSDALHPVQRHEAEFEKIHHKIDEAMKTLEDVRFKGNERLLTLEHKLENCEERLEKEEKQTEAMLEIAYSVREISTTVKRVVNTLDDQAKDISHLKGKPGEMALRAVIFVSGIVATSAILGIITLLGDWLGKGV